MGYTRKQLKRIQVFGEYGRERVQFPDSHPTECQWEFRVDRDDTPLWTDEEKAVIEETLMQHTHGGVNNYWSFQRIGWCNRVLVTRGNWRYNEWVDNTPEAIVASITHWYEERNRLLKK